MGMTTWIFDFLTTLAALVFLHINPDLNPFLQLLKIWIFMDIHKLLFIDG